MGTEKDNSNQLHGIMVFPSMEAVQAFGRDEELIEIRQWTGAADESSVMTQISNDYFTNYPNLFMKNSVVDLSDHELL